MLLSQSEIHDTLVRARNYLDVHGFCKGRLEDNDGRVCLRGAIMRSKAPGMLYCETLRPCEEAMGFVFVEGTENPRGAVYFNNQGQTTKEDVLAAFDRGIRNTAPEPIVELEEELVLA